MFDVPIKLHAIDEVEHGSEQDRMDRIFTQILSRWAENLSIFFYFLVNIELFLFFGHESFHHFQNIVHIYPHVLYITFRGYVLYILRGYALYILKSICNILKLVRTSY